MNIVKTAEDLRSVRSTYSGRFVLVPTMGALHQGHLSLIKKAQEIAGDKGSVAVSIFVNPIQFNNIGDLENYPNTLEEDLSLCDKLGVDLVFTPQADSLYAKNRSVSITEESLSNTLCGATRPGHFDGVCTIVAKLFNLFSPSDAVFGKKDYQQFAIIQRMVRDLNFPVTLHGGTTVRQADGLALSSRNALLTKEDKKLAPVIRKALLDARMSFDLGETKAVELIEQIKQMIHAIAPQSKIDYLECVDAESLQSIKTLDRPAVIATAIFFGEVRLIDNIELVPSN